MDLALDTWAIANQESSRTLFPFALAAGSCQTKSMDDVTTPRELAIELGVSAKRIRKFLRVEHGVLSARQLTRWELTGEQAARVRARFRR